MCIANFQTLLAFASDFCKIEQKFVKQSDVTAQWTCVCKQYGRTKKNEICTNYGIWFTIKLHKKFVCCEK